MTIKARVLKDGLLVFPDPGLGKGIGLVATDDTGLGIGTVSSDGDLTSVTTNTSTGELSIERRRVLKR